MKKKRLVGVVAAGGLAGMAALAMTAGSAQAWAPVTCTAAAKHSGNACVLVTDKTDQDIWQLSALSVNGTCLVFTNKKQNYYYPTVAVPIKSTPTVVTYTGGDCQTGRPNEDEVSWRSWAGEDTNFRKVTIKGMNYVPGGGRGCILDSRVQVIHC
jgi:hypothetical protein